MQAMTMGDLVSVHDWAQLPSAMWQVGRIV